MKSLAAKLSLLSLASLGAIGTAHAQDARDSHFDGLYVGGSIGIPSQPNDGDETLIFDTNGDGALEDTVNTAPNPDAFAPGFCGGAATSSAPTNCTNDDDGAEYFGRIGYDRRMGNFVLGAVVEAGKSEARDAVSGFSSTPASYTLSREADYNVGARLRAGYTPNGGVLFYVTGGGAYTRLDNRFTTSNGLNAFTNTGKTNAWGYSGGGGVEAMVTDSLSLGLEYLYTSVSDEDYVVSVTQGSAGVGNPFIQDSAQTDIRRSDDDFNTHSIRATLGFHF